LLIKNIFLYRYPNNHDIFKEILTLLIDFFTSSEENAYISFATDALNAIYHVSEIILHVN